MFEMRVTRTGDNCQILWGWSTPRRGMANLLLIKSTLRCVILCLMLMELFGGVDGAKVYGDFGKIYVQHKSTRKMVTTINHRLYAFNYDPPKKKAFLVKTSPTPNGCGRIPYPPEVSAKIDTVHGSQEDGQPDLILLIEDLQCDWDSKIKTAQLKGYTGIIMYPNISTKKSIGEASISLNEDSSWSYFINISIVSHEDGRELLNYAYPKPYSLKIERDRTLGDKWRDSLADVAKRIRRVFEIIRGRISAFSHDNLKPLAELLFQLGILIVPMIWLVYSIQQRAEEPQARFWERDPNNGSDWSGNKNESKSDSDGSDKNQNLYSTLASCRSLLSVEKDATREQIDSAFRKTAYAYHPDKNAHLSSDEKDRRTEIYKQLVTARDKLLANRGYQ